VEAAAQHGAGQQDRQDRQEGERLGRCVAVAAIAIVGPVSDWIALRTRERVDTRASGASPGKRRPGSSSTTRSISGASGERRDTLESTLPLARTERLERQFAYAHGTAKRTGSAQGELDAALGDHGFRYA
jgi:hypothetical protein